MVPYTLPPQRRAVLQSIFTVPLTAIAEDLVCKGLITRVTVTVTHSLIAYDLPTTPVSPTVHQNHLLKYPLPCVASLKEAITRLWPYEASPSIVSHP